jgi:hypothetical protein
MACSWGFTAFAAFFAVLSVLPSRASVVVAFLAAAFSAMLIQGISSKLMRQPT